MHVDELTRGLHDEAAAAAVGTDPAAVLPGVRQKAAVARRRQRVAAVAVVVLAVGGVVATVAALNRTQTVTVGSTTTATTAPGSTSLPPTSAPAVPLAEAIPWTDATVEPNMRVEYRYHTLPTALTSAPLCGAADLLMEASTDTAAGNIEMYIAVGNSSSSTCALRDWPKVELVAEDGSVIQTNAGTLAKMIPPRTPDVVLLPASWALLGPVAIGTEGCGVPASSELRLTLVGGGGVVKTPFAPGHNGLAEGCIRLPTPTQIGAPPFMSSEALGLTRSLDVSLSAPASVQRGHILVYEVIATNPASPDNGVAPDPSRVAYIGLGSCPLYRETLGSTSGTYLLNCSRRVEIDPGQSVGYEMRLALPSSAPLGRQTLTWDLLEPDLPAVATTITITD